ncbi:hypothetical protein PPERSA_02977 [Pseudocohnilembus persalinus]|uniref:Uncharacterized protein n=1 Tax=Pseudocohnilembus persalinus TaxID=266149 RepID=A0A0V0QEW3_PSEPJ|nr:hypothetical protein PPERSA_02977 [Pseudocohnilembus persalinus]|eukprot:KRX00717.1 hypothetical protein PPERSA_02977 [Pseudocohnilembus persalinus]
MEEISLNKTNNQPLVGIIACEFHDRVGKQIVAQIFKKDESITKSEFDCISEFIVPKDELCGKLIFSYPILAREQIFDIEDIKLFPYLVKKQHSSEVSKDDVKQINFEISQMIKQGSCLDEILIHFEMNKQQFERGDARQQTNDKKNIIIYK